MIFAKVTDDEVSIGWGVDNVIEPVPLVTITSFDVPEIAAATGAAPVEPIKI